MRMRERYVKIKEGGEPMFGKKVRVGQKAPDFVLPANDKRTYSLEDFRGKPLLLSFARSSG